MCACEYRAGKLDGPAHASKALRKGGRLFGACIRPLLRVVLMLSNVSFIFILDLSSEMCILQGRLSGAYTRPLLGVIFPFLFLSFVAPCLNVGEANDQSAWEHENRHESCATHVCTPASCQVWHKRSAPFIIASSRSGVHASMQCSARA